MRKYRTIISCILLFFIILLVNLLLIPNNMDEIWNYGFSYAIRLGEIPYRDFNMVLPPFYSLFMTIPLLLWNNYLSFIIFHSLILSLSFYLLFKMYKDYGHLLLVIGIVLFSNIYPTYNSFIIALCVFIIYLEKSKYKYKDLLIGLLIACSILTKHTVGIFFVIPTLIFLKKNKINLKSRLIGFIIPFIFIILYLLITGSLGYAFDMCIMGMFDFSNNSHGLTISFVIFIILLLISIYIVYKNKKNISNYYIIFCYTLFIPLFDGLHLFYIMFLFMLLIGENFSDRKVLNYKLLWLVAVFVICMSIKDRFVEDIIYPNKLNHFEYRYYTKSSLDHYEEIYDYIKDRDYIYYDDEAYFFKIITNKKIDKLDLVNHGNHGYNGSSKIIKYLKNNSDKKILINNNTGDRINKKKTQLDKDGYEYIMNNYEKIDTILNYDVYKYKEDYD